MRVVEAMPVWRNTTMVAAAMVAGCVAPLPHPVGHDFSRAAFSTFVLQTTTLPDVEAAIGAPLRLSTISGTANQQALIALPGTPIALTVANYFYAPVGGTARQPQVPSKFATMVFFQGKLVGYDVNSTIPGDDNPPIPEDRLSGLKRGRTTRAQAIALLGPPDGQSVVFAEPASHRSSVITYNWLHVADGMVERKLLKLDFDGSGLFTAYTMVDNSFPLGSGPIPFPAPSPSQPPSIAKPVPLYADPNHT
jgi:hypothetical protein